MTTISRAADHIARVLSAEEEGELAWEGAVARRRRRRRAGRRLRCRRRLDPGDGRGARAGCAWSRSFAVGSLRLTAAKLDGDPPTAAQLAGAAAYVEELLGGFRPPPVDSVLAVGGSARAISRLVGRRLDEAGLVSTIELMASRPAKSLADELPFDTARAATLAGGATILLAVHRRFGVPLELGRGGLREGAVARLLARRQAA